MNCPKCNKPLLPNQAPDFLSKAQWLSANMPEWYSEDCGESECFGWQEPLSGYVYFYTNDIEDELRNGETSSC